MRRIEYLAICVALSAFSSLSPARIPQEEVPKLRSKERADAENDSERLEWPTFEPFEFARLIHAKSFDENSGTFDPEFSAKQLRELIDGLQNFEELSDAAANRVRLKMAWSLVPIFLIELEPLIHDLDWDASELDLAVLATNHLKLLPEGVEVDLAAPEGRRKGLEKIVKWFTTQVKDPIRYGEMILSMNQGPYVGIVAEVTANAKIVGAVDVTKSVELKLLDVEGADRRIAAYRDGELIWARTFMHFDSREAVNNVRFLSRRIEVLGSYGFRVEMNYGENLSLYLDPDGNFQFYLQSF